MKLFASYWDLDGRLAGVNALASEALKQAEASRSWREIRTWMVARP